MKSVEERDALYRALLDALEDPGKVSVFEDLASEAPPGSYTALKAPRYTEALKNWKATGQPRADALRLAEALFNAGLYFDAHEYLEASWRQAEEPWKETLQGLIQLAAGFHKLELDPGGRAGALYLLERGLQKLRAHPDLLGEGTAQSITEALGPALAAIGAGKSPAPKPLRWT